ncbi:hypothetical protein M8C21_014563 [Ambrosia artemisiifolia]|uniref:Sugar phosphate transporter domain-containing protein n=1 Tax=Ambrosia artemisiifolia TaxID=4212 RepID=A0AAD5CDQ6_AMBAR|nr:hypothetical protein M8C21_014563 [Ambrosia artemisiifolia]
MESCALRLSSSILNPKPSNIRHRIIPSSSPSTINYKTTHSDLSLTSYNSIFNNSFSLNFQKRIHYDFAVASAAASASEPSSQSTNPAEFGPTLQLAAMFGIWYLLNIYFNIFNKQVLKVFPYPTTLTTFQFGCGTLMVLIMWTLKLHPRPKFHKSQIVPVLVLGVTHTMGNLLTNVSLGKVSVSFTHTIKALEPFFTVLFSVLLLSETPTIWVISSLLPIVSGVALASFTEASFNWIGFASAMASNVTNQSRFKLTPEHLQLAISYMILAMVSPVTHAVGNCVKRVVVIVSSVIFFQTPVSPINSLGTGLALAGVFLYSRVKRIKPLLKPKAA